MAEKSTETDEHPEILASTLVFPTGTDPHAEDDYGNLRAFALDVSWRGPQRENGQGGWAISHRGDDNQLSRAGNWAWPQSFQRHQYRWPTREAALAMAREHVDRVKVNGRTWQEWQAYFAARNDQTGSGTPIDSTKETT